MWNPWRCAPPSSRNPTHCVQVDVVSLWASQIAKSFASILAWNVGDWILWSMYNLLDCCTVSFSRFVLCTCIPHCRWLLLSKRILCRLSPCYPANLKFRRFREDSKLFERTIWNCMSSDANLLYVWNLNYFLHKTYSHCRTLTAVPFDLTRSYNAAFNLWTTSWHLLSSLLRIPPSTGIRVTLAVLLCGGESIFWWQLFLFLTVTTT